MGHVKLGIDELNKITNLFSTIKTSKNKIYSTLKAHPSESGDLPDSYEFKIATHEQFEQRIEAAQSLKNKFKPLNITCPLLVDFMDDKANKAYGALPERLYILLNGKIVYMGGQGPMDYKINEVEDWLRNHKQN